METLLAYWPIIVLTLFGFVVVYTTAMNFITGGREKQLEAVKKWLLWAVVAAEKTYGGGTGRIKLLATYNAFVTSFPAVARWISFEQFSSLVDAALKEMKELLAENQAIAAYVGGDTDDNTGRI